MADNTRDDPADEKDCSRGVWRRAAAVDPNEEITQAEIDAIVAEWNSRDESPDRWIRSDRVSLTVHPLPSEVTAVDARARRKDKTRDENESALLC